MCPVSISVFSGCSLDVISIGGVDKQPIVTNDAEQGIVLLSFFSLFQILAQYTCFAHVQYLSLIEGHNDLACLLTSQEKKNCGVYFRLLFSENLVLVIRL